MSGFIQITDTHIVSPGMLAYNRSDTAEALRRAVETINAKLPLWSGIDCAIVTGDLTDHGTPMEYAHFLSIMDGLALPWLAIPGNHDRRGPMRKALAGASWLAEAGPLHWVRDFGPFSVIGLDTLLEGAHHGMLCGEGMEFLDSTLSAMGSQPAVVATHHPFMHTGIPSMDADNLRNGAGVIARLEAHPGRVRMISGHVHRTATGQIGRVMCQISPATCHALLTDNRVKPPPRFVLEPGAVTVHKWLEQSGVGLVSDVIPTGVFPGPWPFLD